MPFVSARHLFLFATTTHLLPFVSTRHLFPFIVAIHLQRKMQGKKSKEEIRQLVVAATSCQKRAGARGTEPWMETETKCY